MSHNMLYYGDNLDILKRYIKDESIDLIYLDPPFKSNQDYNVLYAEQDGSKSKAQIKAFEDTWKWDQISAKTFQEIIENSPDNVSKVMQAFHTFLGPSDMLAYLSMMAPRLLQLHRVLKLTGSIYLHCDPTASHYLKMLMDAIFKPENFINEIVWHYRKWPAGKYTFQRNHDILLFYSRSTSRERIFNQLYMERAVSTLKRFGNSKIISQYDDSGTRLPSETSEEISQGVRQDDVWDIGRVPPVKQLFPTEKPLLLLDRIIRASSNENDLVLDPFCGCGTTIVAAQALNRKWIGIDITHLAINLIKHRLTDIYGNRILESFDVIGEPVSISDAISLAEQDPFQFQWWALGLFGARPIEIKKGADQGIDGRLYFHDEYKSKTKQIIFSVKSGKASVKDIRDLRGVLDREKAQIGILIVLEPPTKPMITEAASAGFYHSPGWSKDYPKIQIHTIKDLLNGNGLDKIPHKSTNITFKKASKPTSGNMSKLPFDE